MLHSFAIVSVSKLNMICALFEKETAISSRCSVNFICHAGKLLRKLINSHVAVLLAFRAELHNRRFVANTELLSLNTLGYFAFLLQRAIMLR